MTTPPTPDDKRLFNLEARWEAVMRGEATPEEIAALRGEIAEAGRQAEFEAQAEVAAAVRGLATRYEAPRRLRRHLADLAEMRKRPRGGALWWAAVGGALAASLVFAVGLSLLRGTAPPTANPFARMAKEAREEYQRAMIDPKPIQTGSTELHRIRGWFQPRVGFYPQVYFPGDEKTALEGGRVGYMEGVKVAIFLYRRKGKPLALVIFRAPDNPLWSKIPPKKWVAMTEDEPTACVWRRGNFIYALVGEAPLKKMRELSRAITPPGKNI